MKQEKIEVRLSSIEKDLIKIVTANKKISMSDYIRELIYNDLKQCGILNQDAQS